jgi:two-component system, NarL family, nitrate/nitrite response regulator NarL
LRLVLCDDHRLFVESLAVILQERGWDVLAVLDRPGDAVRACVEYEPDVCLLDAGFDGDATAGIAVAHEIGEQAPATRILVLSGSDDPEVIAAAVSAGVAGYALKTCPVETLMSSIERVAAGEPVIETELLRRALLHGSGRTNPVAQLTRHLTQREHEVLLRLVKGEATAAIAANMGIQQATARSHIQNVLTKLGVHSRLEAVALAVRSGVSA